MVFLLNKSPVPNITGSDTPSQARFLGCLSQLLLLVPRMGGVMPGMEKPVMYQNAATHSRLQGLPAGNCVQVQLVHGKRSRDQLPFRNELY